MSITDELREWFKDRVFLGNGYAELTAIADRIDAEHERVMSRAGQLLADAEKDRDDNYANWQECKQKVLQGNITFGELEAEIERLKDELLHCIELPKDADGEYIHIGDVMESKGSDFLFGEASFEVRSMRHDECGWEVYDRLGDRYAPSLLRHHHELTVEEVLRDYASRILIAGCIDEEDELVAEYAAKLRLAEGADA